jgi:hypothetical protein
MKTTLGIIIKQKQIKQKSKLPHILMFQSPSCDVKRRVNGKKRESLRKVAKAKVVNLQSYVSRAKTNTQGDNFVVKNGQLICDARRTRQTQIARGTSLFLIPMDG